MNRVEQEKQVVEAMIKVYCRRKHHSKTLCPECEALYNYANKRLSCCRHGENKSFCSACPTHCYAPKYKEEIKKVMRYSGPWMLIYHPIMAIKHVLKK